MMWEFEGSVLKPPPFAAVKKVWEWCRGWWVNRLAREKRPEIDSWLQDASALHQQILREMPGRRIGTACYSPEGLEIVGDLIAAGLAKRLVTDRGEYFSATTLGTAYARVLNRL